MSASRQRAATRRSLLEAAIPASTSPDLSGEAQAMTDFRSSKTWRSRPRMIEYIFLRSWVSGSPFLREGAATFGNVSADRVWPVRLPWLPKAMHEPCHSSAGGTRYLSSKICGSQRSNTDPPSIMTAVGTRIARRGFSRPLARSSLSTKLFRSAWRDRQRQKLGDPRSPRGRFEPLS